MSACLYDLQYFYNMEKSEISYHLPSEIMENIKVFESLNVDNNSNNKKKEKMKQRMHSMDDWEALRNFKPTKKVEVKEGIDKLIYDLRNALNKISDKNVENQTTLVLNILKEIENNNEMTELNRNEVVNVVYNIISVNKVYSMLYVRLFKKLIENFECFKEKNKNIIEELKDDILKLDYKSPEDNYDEYCKYNKINDKIKSRILFISNLLKEGVLSFKEYNDFVIYNIKILLEGIESENIDFNNLEEITENIYIQINFLKSEEIEKVEYSDIEEYINIVNLKVKDCKKISKRCKFRILDIVDLLE